MQVPVACAGAGTLLGDWAAPAFPAAVGWPTTEGALPMTGGVSFAALVGDLARLLLSARNAPGAEEARVAAVRGEAIGVPGRGVGDRDAGEGAGAWLAPPMGGPGCGPSALAVTSCHGLRGAAGAAAEPVAP